MDAFIVYLGCFAIGILFLLGTALFAGDTGGDHGGDMGDAGGGGHDHGHGFILSPMLVASFLTAFGAFGMIFDKIEATSSPWVSGTLAVVGGVGIAAAVVGTFRAVVKRTQSSSESRVATLVGLTATVTSPIPLDGVGEIAYVQAGSRYTAPARAEGALDAINNGTPVTITRIVGTQFYVKKA